MNKEDIREKLRISLSHAGLTAEEIRVQLDPYAGWRIAIVSADWESMSHE